MFKFYGHFAAAYGTMWLIMLVAALVSRSHINAGSFGFFGFPLIALFYAIIRMASDNNQVSETEELRDRLRRLEARLTDRREPRHEENDRGD